MSVKKSSYEKELEKELLKLDGKKVSRAIRRLLSNRELEYLMEYANTVSIKRLNYNDHGRVHAKIVALNGLKILNTIKDRVKLNLEKEGFGEFEDSRVVVLIGGFLHDIGMSLGRDEHELHSVLLCDKYIDHAIKGIYSREEAVAIKSMIKEGIAGHMGTRKITSIEAGIIPIADGTDMSAGRSRIPLIISSKENRGDIHEFSAEAIETVEIKKGSEKDLAIIIKMNNPAGVFQIEQILLPKIRATPLKNRITVEAWLGEHKIKYL